MIEYGPKEWRLTRVAECVKSALMVYGNEDVINMDVERLSSWVRVLKENLEKYIMWNYLVKIRIVRIGILIADRVEYEEIRELMSEYRANLKERMCKLECEKDALLSPKVEIQETTQKERGQEVKQGTTAAPPPKMTTAGPEGEGICPAEGPTTPPIEKRGKQSRVYEALLRKQYSRDETECLQAKFEMLATLNTRHHYTSRLPHGIALHHPRRGVVVVVRRKKRVAVWEGGGRRKKRWKKAIREGKS